MKKKTTQKAKKSAHGPVWNLGLLYKSPEDPQIEKDMQEIEKMCAEFAGKYDVAEKNYLNDDAALFEALTAYEKLSAYLDCKPLMYFYYLRHSDASNNKASSAIQLLSSRVAKAVNHLQFFEISIGTVSASTQKKFLSSEKLRHFQTFLKRVFDDARHRLSVPEEKILSLKSLPAASMWVDANDRVLNQLTVKWKGKIVPVEEANTQIAQISNPKDRYALYQLTTSALKSISAFSEAELNALFTDKKIDDELRHFETPFADTVRIYRNDPKVVEQLVDVVTKSFAISHRFYKVKAKILKLKKLRYADRGLKNEKIKAKFDFNQSVEKVKKIFGDIDPKFASILDSFVKNGQIDAYPRVGKEGGAYCWGSYFNPTFVLLNHTDNLYALSTLAHEMGHAIHTELSRSQSPLYASYSYSLAETASTLFESIAIGAIYESLSDKEKIILLHDMINDDIATIFRQVACFNFENELHGAIRKKGFVPKEEICELHNKNMKAYLGPLFDMKPDDGYFFVQWGHLRRFFYVYSYAYGQLVTKALLRRYRKDKSFWKSIEKFLSAGGKASPEEILMEIGIDVSKPEFWKEGLKEIEDNITKLEKLVAKKK